MSPESSYIRVPLWFALVCVLVCLPALAMPFLPGMEYARSVLGPLYGFFPVYVCAAALCAWLSWRRGRRDVAWVLVALVLISDAGVIFLADGYGIQ